jgi:hypothetical protein
VSDFAGIEAPQQEAARQAANRLRAHLAEDTAIAQAAVPGPWAATKNLATPLVAADLWGWTQDEDDYGEPIAQDIPRDTAVHIARHHSQRVLDQCGSLTDALTDLERIAERSPDPDSRMWARGIIHHLARIWESDEVDDV